MIYFIVATFGLNEDQVAIQQLARDFAKNELQPYMSKWDQEQIFPVETLKKAAALGFGAVYTRPDYGGTGLTRLEASVVFEALSQGCVSTTAYITIHKYVKLLSIAQRARKFKKVQAKKLVKSNKLKIFFS